MKILEASTRGDKRYSAFCASVEVYGVFQSIEQHYQLAKRFVFEEPPANWREAKGREPDWFEIGGHSYPVHLLDDFYQALWDKYLNEHPELVEHALTFDEIHDTFAQVGHNDQATCITNYLMGYRSEFKLP